MTTEQQREYARQRELAERMLDDALVWLIAGAYDVMRLYASWSLDHYARAERIASCVVA